jgi:hypothetical protein
MCGLSVWRRRGKQRVRGAISCYPGAILLCSGHISLLSRLMSILRTSFSWEGYVHCTAGVDGMSR